MVKNNKFKVIGTNVLQNYELMKYQLILNLKVTWVDIYLEARLNNSEVPLVKAILGPYTSYIKRVQARSKEYKLDQKITS